MEFWLRDRPGKKTPEVVLCPQSTDEERYLRSFFTLILYGVSAHHQLYGEDESYYPASGLIAEPVYDNEENTYTPEDSPYCIPGRKVLKQLLKDMGRLIAETEANIETHMPCRILDPASTLGEIERFDALRATHHSVCRQLAERGYFLATTETGSGTSFSRALNHAVRRWAREMTEGGTTREPTE